MLMESQIGRPLAGSLGEWLIKEMASASTSVREKAVPPALTLILTPHVCGGAFQAPALGLELRETLD